MESKMILDLNPTPRPSPCEAEAVTRTISPALIRVYGDSLSLPRWEDGISFDWTYPEIVRRKLAERSNRTIHLYNRSQGGATIRELKRLWESDSRYFGKSDEILILQLGIVDCAPRPLGPRLRHLLGKAPHRIRQPIVRFLHSNRARILRAGLGSRFTSPRDFRNLYTDWLQNVCKRQSWAFVFNIAPTLPHVDAHSPGLAASITAYNSIIADIITALRSDRVRLLDAYSAILKAGVEICIHAEDGHHITGRGHQLYAELLLNELRRVFDFS